MASDNLNQTFLVIGYGSLLSGYGLLGERRGGSSRLVARDAEPVKILNARRGLAKPSSHGGYLAMDIEPIDRKAPIAAAAPSMSGGIGGLLLTFDRKSAPLLARREEYDGTAFERILSLADAAGKRVAEFLMKIAERANFDLLAYRTALREILGYTSPGYVFHPVPLADGRAAIMAIGSGFEGSGDPAVISRRREFGIDRLHPLGAALALKSAVSDRDGQVGYHAECLLGGVHGIDVSDLLADLSDAELSRMLARFLRAEMPAERARFLLAASLDERRYRDRFLGAPDPALARLLNGPEVG